MKSPDSFVPLTAATAPSAPREFHVAILNGHDHDHGQGSSPSGVAKASGFQSLESQRPVSANSGIANVGSGISTAAEAQASGNVDKKLAEPRVTVQRDGDRVTSLRIQCSCGMIMELACVYDAPAAKA